MFNIKLIFAIIVLLGMGSAGNAISSGKTLKPCSVEDLVDLNKTIKRDEDPKSPMEVRWLVNTKKQVVGFYAWEKDELGMSAEVCHGFWADEGLTAAPRWSYWQDDETGTNPASWKVSVVYEFTQDEGKASFKYLGKSKNGVPMGVFKVIGWNDNSDEIVLTSDVVTLEQNINK